MSGIPEGFELCEQCGAHHRPVAGVCKWKLEKDAAFVLDAAGACLSLAMMERTLRELDIKESYRYVSSPHQHRAYLMTGKVLAVSAGWPRKETADDGAEWVMRVDYPPDVLLIESDGGVGLIKSLQVPPRTQEEE